MKNTELIDKIIKLKEENGYTLHHLANVLDIQVTTIERWFRTKRINRLYADIVKNKLNI